MINWSRVNELRDEVGAEDFDEVVELFLEEVEEVMTGLRQGPDAAQLEQNLHFLKGSALNLGFQHFADLCQAGEKASATGAAEAVEITAILATFDESKTQFQAGLPKL